MRLGTRLGRCHRSARRVRTFGEVKMVMKVGGVDVGWLADL